jgi:plastocyanin
MPRSFFLFPLLSMVSCAVTAGGIAADVVIVGFTYSPPDVTIEAGETIAFEASGFHPLAFDDNEALGCSQNCNVIFRTPGEYGFYCENHGNPGSGMFGTVTVTDSTIEDRVFIDPFELSFD